MTRGKVAVISGISIVVAAGIILSIWASSQSQNENNQKDESLNLSLPDESLAITDSAIVNKSETPYIIDEEGRKTYIINVGDSPDLSD